MAGILNLTMVTAYVGLPTGVTYSDSGTGPRELNVEFNVGTPGEFLVNRNASTTVIGSYYASPLASYPVSSEIRYTDVSGTAINNASPGMSSGAYVSLGSTPRFIGLTSGVPGTYTSTFDVEIRNSVSFAVLAIGRITLSMTVT